MLLDCKAIEKVPVLLKGRDTTFRSIALFLSVVEGLRTYLVQDTTSSEVLLILQVLLTENRPVLNTALRDRKRNNSKKVS